MSGRQKKPSRDATRAFFAACQALDLPAMACALENGADIHAIDQKRHRPLGVMLTGWRASRHRPAPAPFIGLFARHGADLSRPGGKDTPHTVAWLSLTDRDVRVFDALDKAGMDLDGIDEADGPRHWRCIGAPAHGRPQWEAAARQATDPPSVTCNASDPLHVTPGRAFGRSSLDETRILVSLDGLFPIKDLP